MNHQLDWQKEIYDRRVHGKPFEPGELVWLYCPATSRGQCRKFHWPWMGPYWIIHKLSDVTYRIQNVRAHQKWIVVHFNRLNLCPPDMCIPEGTPDLIRGMGPGLLKEMAHLPTLQPHGINFQLVETDDTPPMPRYPRRECGTPAYFQAGSSYWAE